MSSRYSRALRRGVSAAIYWIVILTIVAAGVSVAAPAKAQPPATEPAATAAPAADAPVAPAASSSVHAVTLRLNATQDTYISSSFPTTNFGGLSQTKLGWNNNEGAMRMLIQFSLSGIPNTARITSATFNIFQQQVLPAGDRPMDFRAQFATQNWGEFNATWSNANFIGGSALPLGSIPGSIGYVSGNATSVVQAWFSGQQPNRGLIVTGDETTANNRSRVFASRESGNPPFLSVTYEVNCDTAAPVSTMGSLPSWSPGSFRVSWSAVDPSQPNCPPSGVANYDVRYRINGGSWVSWRNQTTSTSNNFSAAPSGSTVDFQARATDNAGNVGNWSSSVTTRVDTTTPTATMNALPQYTSNVPFVVSWSGGGSPSGIASYEVQYQIDNGSWLLLTGPTGLTSTSVGNATLGQTWAFRVRATNNAGAVGSWSAPVSTFILTVPVSIVSKFNPAVLQSTAPVTTSFPVAWLSYAPPGITLTQIDIFFRYTPFGQIPAGGFTRWKSFTLGNGSDSFVYSSGDGIYEFFSQATGRNSSGQTVQEPYKEQAEATMFVDLGDTVQPGVFLPFVARNDG